MQACRQVLPCHVYENAEPQRELCVCVYIDELRRPSQNATYTAEAMKRKEPPK